MLSSRESSKHKYNVISGYLHCSVCVNDTNLQSLKRWIELSIYTKERQVMLPWRVTVRFHVNFVSLSIWSRICFSKHIFVLTEDGNPSTTYSSLFVTCSGNILRWFQSMYGAHHLCKAIRFHGYYIHMWSKHTQKTFAKRNIFLVMIFI